MVLPAIPIAIGSFVLLVGLLLRLPWEKNLLQELPRIETVNRDEDDIVTDTYTRELVYFFSKDIKCEAWLYLPNKRASGRPPVIMMSHGIGCQKDMGLHPYAEHFVQAGIAVFAFDFRTFGGSDGEPRHWTSPKRHLEDWTAAVDFVKESGLGGRVDADRLALWGVSFSGGHVLVMAARLGHHVSAVVANEPFLTTKGSDTSIIQERGLSLFLRLVAAALSDRLRYSLGLRPVYLRLVGELGELALLRRAESEVTRTTGHRYSDKPQGGWRNQILARGALEIVTYHPIDSLSQIEAPVFFRGGLYDTVCPLEKVKKASKMVKGPVVLQERPMSHIQAHDSGHSSEEIAPVISFLRERLNV